jgi:hypothetical protein
VHAHKKTLSTFPKGFSAPEVELSLGTVTYVVEALASTVHSLYEKRATNAKYVDVGDEGAERRHCIVIDVENFSEMF